MKQVNFSHEGGFPLEQETLERLQNAYRTELYGALKAHFSIESGKNYIIARPTATTQGWAIVHHEKHPLNSEESLGILYPIKKGTSTDYLKTIRTGTNLIYGTGISQTAYFDYEAIHINETEYNNGIANPPVNNDTLAVDYLYSKNFKTITDIATIEEILKKIDEDIKNLKTNVESHSASIQDIKDSYLPLDGSKAMTGNLTVGGKIYLNQADQVDSKFSNAPLLVLGDQNKISKTNTSMSELIRRLDALESRPIATGIPIGMIAIWGKSAPFPNGWKEYIPLTGKMPVGLYNPSVQERNEQQDGDGGNGVTYYRDSNGVAVFPFDTLGNTAGQIGKKLTIAEMPSHRHGVGLFSGTGDNGAEKYISEPYEEDSRRAGDFTDSQGGGQQFSILNPYRVVQFIEYTGLSSDQSAPTPPTNLTVTNINSTSLTLSWTTSTDNIAVTTYLISVNNGSAVSIGGNFLSYDVSGLSPSTLYNFRVFARDAAGNISDPSLPANATTTALEVKPTAPEITSAILETSKDVLLQWNLPPANESVVSYDVWRRAYTGTSASIGTTESLGFSDPYTEYSTTYRYKVRAKNATGNFSDFSVEKVITTDQDPN